VKKSGSINSKVRNFGSRLLLRGAVGRRWNEVKSARVAERMRKLLRATAEAKLVSPRPVTAATSLRRLLFICANMWERRELLPELQKLCDVTFIDVNSVRTPAARPADERLDFQLLRPLLDSCVGTSFDLIIVYLHSALLSDELLNYLRTTWKCPLVGMNLDDKTTYLPSEIFKSWSGNYRSWASRFDCNLSNSAALADVYRAQGFQCLYLPTGFHYDPALHRFDREIEFRHHLSFVGSWKPERAAFIEQLHEAGVAVEIFGGGWRNASFSDEGWKVYRASQLNLGIGYNLPGTQFTNLKNRDFECPGAGGCYITTYDWELANLLEVGKEVLCYRDLTDFVEQYTWYSRRPELCRQIAEAGHLRCINEHTWEKRFAKVFADLGFRLR
jgi:hypothetical protein